MPEYILVNMSRGEVVRVSDELCKLTNYKPPYINDVLCQFKAVGKPYRVKVETTRHIVHIPADDKPSVTTWQ